MKNNFIICFLSDSFRSDFEKMMNRERNVAVEPGETVTTVIPQTAMFLKRCRGPSRAGTSCPLTRWSASPLLFHASAETGSRQEGELLSGLRVVADGYPLNPARSART